MGNIIKFIIFIILVLLIFNFHKRYENFSGNLSRCYETATGKEMLLNPDRTCSNYCYCYNGKIDSSTNQCLDKTKQYCHSCNESYTLSENLCLDANGNYEEIEDNNQLELINTELEERIEEITADSIIILDRNIVVDILIVAGGGGGGCPSGGGDYGASGGGGAGGLLYLQDQIILADTYHIIVGGGGASCEHGSDGNGYNGQDSIAFGNTAIGGGGGGGIYSSGQLGGSGGGGGTSGGDDNGGYGTAGQGNNGASASSKPDAGGGGGSAELSSSIDGGNGTIIDISGTAINYAGGGGGGAAHADSTIGGLGKAGGGMGGYITVPDGGNAIANTGSGGGGAYSSTQINGNGGNGGSGIVLIKYKTSRINPYNMDILRKGLKYHYYDYKYAGNSVDWFDDKTPTSDGYAWDGSNIGTFSDGTRMKDSSNTYSFLWTGYFKANATGTYTFYTKSDDASFLWVGDDATVGYSMDNAIVNNKDKHGMRGRTGTINLTLNTYYPIRIQFGEYHGGDNLVVRFKTPDSESWNTNGYDYYFSY